MGEHLVEVVAGFAAQCARHELTLPLDRLVRDVGEVGALYYGGRDYGSAIDRSVGFAARHPLRVVARMLELACPGDLLGFFEPFIPIKRLRLGWVDVAA